MKKLLVAMLGAVLLLGACGGNGDEPEAPVDDTTDTEETAGGDDVELTYDASNGEAVYQGRCAGCHGGTFEGASAPGIIGLSYEEIMTAIETGPGTMPPDLVTGEDATDVAAWIADNN
ncbi:mono/diheme cytochrome c family protein [Evansella vedderi]|uniref:Mono/diheme cytochrome c family protein n=1 Tax=Evansella vedderi TaxID=38282 RepID=A0ABT9ZVS1_9BACI|nr:cytochrome c [Evansella vedderi]MDQ0254558.1 mono/diheme cytochrome c family protein [Evansella vedderi]